MAALLTLLIWFADILLIGLFGIAAQVAMGLYWADWCAEEDTTDI